MKLLSETDDFANMKKRQPFNYKKKKKRQKQKKVHLVHDEYTSDENDTSDENV